MEDEKKIRVLLSLQERLRPGASAETGDEPYSDEQLRQMLADDPELAELLGQLALAKQALVKREADMEAVPVEEEWRKFVKGSEKGQVRSEKRIHYPLAERSESPIHSSSHFSPAPSHFRKILGRAKRQSRAAASFVGVLLMSGIAFATVRIVRQYQMPEARQVADTTAVADSSLFILRSSLPEDTVATAAPIVFDNVPLGEMLPKIAVHYHKEVEFANGDTRLLRFYFVWKPEEGLEATLRRLNLFESIDIECRGEKIVVR